MYSLAKSAEKHPKLREELRAGTLHEPLLRVFAAEVATGNECFAHNIAASQLAMAQVKLFMYFKPYWDGLEEHHAQMWSEQYILREGAAPGDTEKSQEGPDGQCAANVLYSHARLLHTGVISAPAPERLQEVFISGLMHSAAHMQAQSVALCCWALGRQRMQFGKARTHLTRAVHRVASAMDAPQVGNVFWGYAACQEPLSEVAPALIQRLVDIRDSTDHERVLPKTVSLVVNGYAQLHRPSKAASVSDDLRDEVLGTVAAVAVHFNCHEVAHTVGGLGKLQWQHGVALGPLRAAVDRSCDSMTHQHVAMTLHGYCKSREDLGESTIGLIGRLVSLDVEGYVTPQSVVQAVVAYAQLEATGNTVPLNYDGRHQLISCVAKCARKLSVHQLVLVVSALGKLQWEFGAALRPLQQAVAELPRVTGKNIHMLRKGFSHSQQPQGVAASVLAGRYARE